MTKKHTLAQIRKSECKNVVSNFKYQINVKYLIINAKQKTRNRQIILIFDICHLIL